VNFAKPISELLNDVRKAYIEDQEAKGIRSSGASAKSIRTEAKPTTGTVVGAKYFFQQKHGRKPGKFPTVEDIINWIRAKGIQPNDISERSLAFIIARKIAKQGTDIYQRKRPALDPGEKIQQRVAEFSRQVAKELRKQVIATFK